MHLFVISVNRKKNSESLGPFVVYEWVVVQKDVSTGDESYSLLLTSSSRFKASAAAWRFPGED